MPDHDPDAFQRRLSRIHRAHTGEDANLMDVYRWWADELDVAVNTIKRWCFDGPNSRAPRRDYRQDIERMEEKVSVAD